MCYKLKLIDVITIPMSLSISHVMYYSTVEIGAFKMCVFIGLARIDIM